MSETLENLGHLSRPDRIDILKAPGDAIIIEPAEAPYWRVAIQRLRSREDFDKSKKFTVRKGDDGITRLIRFK